MMTKHLVALMALLLAFPVSAAERLLLGVNTGVPARDEQRDINEKYKPLADYLAAALKRPVRLEVSQSLSASERRLKKDAFDLFLGPPQVIAQAMKSANYAPIARYPGKLKAAFVVMESSGIKSLGDMKGKRLGLPDKESLASQLALAKLRFSRITPDSYFAEIFYQRFQDATLNALKIGRVDVAVVTSGFAKNWVQDHPGSRVIEESYEVVHFAFAVSEDMSEADARHIQQLLLDAPNTADGRIMLEKMGRKEGFVSASKDDYAPLVRLFGL
ncbi:MAG: phosphate/phosphite/phosphonate ABC transporter substrate-binding protein [Sulfurimicrobium sp.]|jgi:ABC-type phosphate/phosphonate transport system substrate-binding protein|nr:phosphate/phosphite/phosphonate ABC transporter substrate-binding protein [Sulfurimicrobium sp.]